MQLSTFLARVLPSTGSYYLVRGNNAKQFKNFEYNSTALVETNAVALNKFNYNIYFSTGSFNPNTTRYAVDVQYKKSFYLDLDCGPGKDFLSKADALTRFKQFKHDSGVVAPTMIVDSGNGLHIWWTLSEPIPTAQWVKIASLFKQIHIQLEFPADLPVTADAARIMRMPNTTNNKNPNKPKECRVRYSKDYDYTAAEFLNSIKHWAHKKQDIPAALAGLEVGDDLSAGVVENRGPKYFKYGKDECLVMQDMLETGGQKYSETAWMHALGLLTYCEDGHDYIHNISNKHTDYTSAETEMKWRIRLKTKEDKDYGPVLCKTLNQVCADNLCSICPHNGRIKSPATLCFPPYSNLAMPHNYYQTDVGIFYKTSDAEEPDIFVHNDPIKRIKLYENTDERGESTTQLLFDIGNRKDIQIDIGILADRRAVHKVLAGQQVIINIKQNPHANMVELMNAWSQQLNNSIDLAKTSSCFGWLSSKKRHGFSIGESTIWDDGTKTPTLSTDVSMVNAYSVKGDVAKWSEAANFVIAQNRGPINCALASAFAAPLICFTDVAGVLMSVVSKDSGAGKSMALSIAAGVWGNPSGTISTMNDTVNSMNQKMGTVRNLPGYWDEIRMMDSFDSFAKTLFQLCEGKEKARLNQNASRRREATWQTMTVAASNESLIAHIDGAIDSSNAGRMRMMEFSSLGVINTPEHVGVELAKKVRENYGGAGRVYAEYLVRNRKKVSDQVASVIGKLYTTLTASNDERFWIALVATILVGASIANKLNLTKFDLKAMQEFLFSEFRAHRASVNTHFKVSATTSSDVISDFINANSDYGISYQDISSKGTVVGAMIPSIDPVKMPVKFEYGIKSGTYKIIQSMFKRWLAEQNRTHATVVAELKHDAKYLYHTRHSVGDAVSGTRSKTVPVIIVRV